MDDKIVYPDQIISLHGKSHIHISQNIYLADHTYTCDQHTLKQIGFTKHTFMQVKSHCFYKTLHSIPPSPNKFPAFNPYQKNNSDARLPCYLFQIQMKPDSKRKQRSAHPSDARPQIMFLRQIYL